MTRRRPTLPAYVRRRWRALGLILVLLAGALLVLVVTDRGHDPLWSARGAEVEQIAVSPDGGVVYTLVGNGDNITRLDARRASDGALLWQSPMNASRTTLMAAGERGVAVATDFPLAFLTIYDVDGTPRFQGALEGNPRAMAIDGDRLALALNAPGNPVYVYDSGSLNATLTFDSFVDAIDARGGVLAVGAGDGEVGVFARNGTRIVNATLAISIRSLSLNADGTVLLVGGSSLRPGDLSGSVTILYPTDEKRYRWNFTTPGSIGLVALDDAGVLALALEEPPPATAIHVLDVGTGAQRWAHDERGSIARDDAGAHGGAAIAHDGSHVVAATLRGPVVAYDARTGATRWSFDSAGSTVVAFASSAHPDVVLANARLSANGPLDGLLLFSTAAEPAVGRLPLVAALLVMAALSAAALVVGIGYWRVRRY